MNDKRTFSVAVIGLSALERHVLKSVFRLSAHRPRSYTLAEFSFERAADILIVDGDDPAAVDKWHTISAQGAKAPSMPTLMVSKDNPPGSEYYHARRPLIATRILAMMDKIAIKEMSFIPEMVIGENAHLSDASAKAVQQSMPLQEKQPRFKALVVDDSLPIRKQIELELKLFGVQMDFAETGEQALEFATKSAYDIIFLDVMLPGIDGYKVCRSIKKQKTTKKTPVIMLTGKSSTFDRVRGKLSGCNTYLTKPVAHDSFHKVVKKYLL